MASLVLTIIADDRPGLVDALSGVITEHGANWEKGHVTQLAGKFAGIVLVTVPDARADEVTAALAALDAEGLLHVTVERADEVAPPEVAHYDLRLVGQDHPGIVHEVSSTLAQYGINISDLRTAVVSAPMAGGTLFEAEATLEVPDHVAVDDLRHALESLAHEIMVDIDLKG